MTFSRYVKFTPRMETALRAAARGPLAWAADGWTSTAGARGTWNSHTIAYLAKARGCLALSADGKRATITGVGRNALWTLDEVAA